MLIHHPTKNEVNHTYGLGGDTEHTHTHTHTHTNTHTHTHTYTNTHTDSYTHRQRFLWYYDIDVILFNRRNGISRINVDEYQIPKTKILVGDIM